MPETSARGRVQVGYNAMENRVENLLEAGVIDPAKVTRNGLRNAAGIAGIMLTTQAVMTGALPSLALPRCREGNWVTAVTKQGRGAAVVGQSHTGGTFLTQILWTSAATSQLLKKLLNACPQQSVLAFVESCLPSRHTQLFASTVCRCCSISDLVFALYEALRAHRFALFTCYPRMP